MKTIYSLIATLVVAGYGFAQDPAPKKQSVAVSQQAGDSELGFFAGAVHSSGTTDFGGGANFAYAVNTYVYPYFEFSYLPNALNSTSGPYRTVGNLVDFHGGVHLRYPLPNNKQVVPYAVFALGGIKTQGGEFQELNTSTGTVVNRTPLSSDVQFAVNYGGGIRYYITNSVGVRFEVTAYGPSSHLGGVTPVRFMGGVFYQFKKK